LTGNAVAENRYPCRKSVARVVDVVVAHTDVVHSIVSAIPEV